MIVLNHFGTMDLVNENDEIRLYYTQGYYYDLVGLLYSSDGRLLKSDTLKVQK